jgi:hypothetical protein
MRCTRRLIARTAFDAAAGLVVFFLIALLAGASAGSADGLARFGNPLPLSADGPAPAEAAPPVQTAPPLPPSGVSKLLAGPGRGTAFYLLAAVFSALVAFNLAFFRHLRRVYAAPPTREDGRRV